MASTLFYPDLKIVPISGIKLQEYIQKDRMQALASAIKREAMLKNPPIVTNFFNGDYQHLDGANRITAVSLLSYPNCLVQVVDYGDPTHVHLSSWSHLAHVNESQFFSSIKKMNNITVKK